MKFTKYQALGEYRMNKRLFAMSPELSTNGTIGIEPDFDPQGARTGVPCHNDGGHDSLPCNSK
jgi:hypothetical protein